MSGAGVRFTEELAGYVAFGEPDHERGAAAGRVAGQPAGAPAHNRDR